MWVPGSVVYLLPLFAIGLRLLFGEREARQPATDDPLRRVGRISLRRGGPIIPLSSSDARVAGLESRSASTCCGCRSWGGS